MKEYLANMLNSPDLLEGSQKKISNLNDIIELKNQSSFKLITNYLVEKTIKCMRFFK